MATASGAKPLLEVAGLTVEFNYQGQWTPVVQDVSFSIGPGETVGLVGESGSGKTVTALSILGLSELQGGRIATGRITFDGLDLIGLDHRALRDIRGGRIGMIFQQATRSLNPAFTVGEQIAETIRSHAGINRHAAWDRAIQLLDHVHIPDAAKRAREYPHMFSGGMCQRVMIAIALACNPVLLIADEPTTALDVTVQAHILDLLREIQEERQIAILFISHDLGVIAEMCHRLMLMYAGQIVERAGTDVLFSRPRHPYTAGLLASIPLLGARDRLIAIPGNVPAPGSWGTGCHFLPRCTFADVDRCGAPIPLTSLDEDASVRCARALELDLAGTSVG
jgi:peptide/nickel transport system ATP-binding protein/oligopeptide transport system ATP-binding protein